MFHVSTEPKDNELNVEKVKGRHVYHFFKRVLDISASATALVLMVPLFAYLAFKIHHEDGGPIYYSQTRIGKNGTPFEMYKFRSMIVNADKFRKKLKQKNEIAGAMFKIKDDPRVTKIGHFIRKHSLDELPQLYNVLIGNMSLVGPRPPLPSEFKNYTQHDKLRLKVIPGCTGLWQVTKRNEASFEEMVDLDLKYINRSSFLYDLKLIFKTFDIMINPNSAY